MEILIAIGHIVGALILLFILSCAIMAFAGWEVGKVVARRNQDLSVSLGVPVTELNNRENVPRFIKFSSERYSHELFRNRLSDFCGIILTAWVWFGALLGACVLATVLWFTITESRDMAVFAWTTAPLLIFFWITEVLLSFTCRLLTGRYPGEAHNSRRDLAEFIKNQKEEAEFLKSKAAA